MNYNLININGEQFKNPSKEQLKKAVNELANANAANSSENTVILEKSETHFMQANKQPEGFYLVNLYNEKKNIDIWEIGKREKIKKALLYFLKHGKKDPSLNWVSQNELAKPPPQEWERKKPEEELTLSQQTFKKAKAIFYSSIGFFILLLPGVYRYTRDSYMDYGEISIFPLSSIYTTLIWIFAILTLFFLITKKDHKNKMKRFDPSRLFLGIALFYFLGTLAFAFLKLFITWQISSSKLFIYTNLYNIHIVLFLVLIFSLLFKLALSAAKKYAEKNFNLLKSKYIIFVLFFIFSIAYLSLQVIQYSFKYSIEVAQSKEVIEMKAYLMGHWPTFSREWQMDEIDSIVLEECRRIKIVSNPGTSGDSFIPRSHLYFIFNSGERLEVAFAEKSNQKTFTETQGWNLKWAHEELYQKAKEISELADIPLKEEECKELHNEGPF